MARFGTSGRVEWHTESQFDPNLSRPDVTVRIQGAGWLEGYQFLIDMTHLDTEDGLSFVTRKVYVRTSKWNKSSRFIGIRL